MWVGFVHHQIFFSFLPSTILSRIRPGTVPGPRFSSVRTAHGLQVWHWRLGVVLLQHGLSPPGGEEGVVLGRRPPHVERAAAKVCGYVVSCFFFHSLVPFCVLSLPKLLSLQNKFFFREKFLGDMVKSVFILMQILC